MEPVADKAVKNFDHNWPVYRHYEIVEEGGEAFVVAPPSFHSVFEPETEANEDSTIEPGKLGGVQRRSYAPRQTTEEPVDYYNPIATSYTPLKAPELVVELARLADSKITPESMRSWAEVHGLLGLRDDNVGPQKVDSESKFVVVSGTRKESVARFEKAARQVRACLRVYEAVTADKELDIEALLLDVQSSFSQKAWLHRTRREGYERSWLYGVLGRMVQINLYEYCYPQFVTHYIGEHPTGEFSTSPGYKGLIGAIWLQMAWLLEADSKQVRRCEVHDCRRVITFESGKSADEVGSVRDGEGKFKKNLRGKYKTRRDRKYCQDRPCKQNYHARKKAGWEGYD